MTSLTWVISVIAMRGLLSLLALWLRLRWQAQQQEERHHYLVAIARALPEGSQIDEAQPDGAWLRLASARPQASEADHG